VFSNVDRGAVLPLTSVTYLGESHQEFSLNLFWYNVLRWKKIMGKICWEVWLGFLFGSLI